MRGGRREETRDVDTYPGNERKFKGKVEMRWDLEARGGKRKRVGKVSFNVRVTGKYICFVRSDEEESENEKWGRQREGGIEGGVIKPVEG